MQHSNTLDMYQCHVLCMFVLAEVGLAQKICHHVLVSGLPFMTDPFRNVKVCPFGLHFDHANDPSFSRFSKLVLQGQGKDTFGYSNDFLKWGVICKLCYSCVLLLAGRKAKTSNT